MAGIQLQQVGLPADLVQRLHERHLVTARDLFSRTLVDLVEVLDLPYDTVDRIRRQVAVKIVPNPVTALDLLRQATLSPAFLRTTLPPLDVALLGGLPAGSVTELVGPAGLGKTQFCLTMCVVGCLDRVAAEGRVLYLDTEHKFNAQRLEQVATARFPASFESPGAVRLMLDRVLIKAPDSSEELLSVLDSLEGAILRHGIKLIIIDSIAALARVEYDVHSVVDRQRMLGQQASRLKYLAERFLIPVLVTNQVTAAIGRERQPDGGGLVAALGPMWAHAVNTRLVLAAQRGAGGEQLRVLMVAKSPAAPNISLPYRVTAAGLEWLQGVQVPPPEPGSVVDMIISNYKAYEAGGHP